MLLIVALVVVIVVLVVLWHQEHERAERVRVQSEENWSWSELHCSEADAAQRELLALEKRHATLQLLHADAQRRLIAKNFVIEYGKNQKRIFWCN